MEQILTKNSNKVDAVVASNDGMAGGVVAALSARGLKGVPVSGQDGDHAALNRVALGTQTVSVWKDSRDLGREAANAAVSLATGRKSTATWAEGEKKIEMNRGFLKAVPVTQANLDVRQGRSHHQEKPCKGVAPATHRPPASNVGTCAPLARRRSESAPRRASSKRLGQSSGLDLRLSSWQACWS